MVWCFGNIHIHRARFCAGTAGNTCIAVNAHLKQGYMIHKCIDRPQGAQPFAERAVKNHAAYHNCQQNAEFPAEQLSQSSSYARVCKRKRNCALQYALRTQVLAEERIPHAGCVDNNSRKQYDHDQQYRIFDIAQRFQASG